MQNLETCEPEVDRIQIQPRTMEKNGSLDITQEHINLIVRIASPKWWGLGTLIGIPDYDLKKIQLDSDKYGVEHMCREMLSLWIIQRGKGATLRDLRYALIQNGQRAVTEDLQNMIHETKNKIQDMKIAVETHASSKVFEKKEEVVSDKILLRVAQLVNGKWILLAIQLGADPSTIDVLDIDYSVRGVVNVCHKMLLQWRQAVGFKATYTSLLVALRERDFNSVADIVETELEKMSSQKI